MLNQIEECLKVAGSSMAKALKCNVYFARIQGYKEMNDAFCGRFGAENVYSE